MTSTFDLNGKVAIVTGCNTGWGEGIALALASAESDIASVNRSAPSAACKAIESMGRLFAHLRRHFILDSSPGSMNALRERSMEAFGKVDPGSVVCLSSSASDCIHRHALAIYGGGLARRTL